MNLGSSQTFAKKMIVESRFLSQRYLDIDLTPWTDFDNRLLPIPLLSSFGGDIAREFEIISPDEWTELVALIEKGLTSHDDDISTAVATGLVEALVNVAELEEGRWPRIDAVLGPEARGYADAYRNAAFMNR